MKRLSLVILLTSIWSLSFSQEKEFTDITDILEKYAEHSAAEEFEKALEVLERVPNYDSLFDACPYPLFSAYSKKCPRFY